MPKLHGVNLSPYVRKVRVALGEKGVAYELVPVMPFQTPPGFEKLSPAGKIPVWQEDDGWALPDSSAILAYLERIYPQPALYPTDPRSYGRALFLEEYADTKLLEVLSPVFMERFVKPMRGQEPDEAAVTRALETRIPPVFDYLESQIGSGEGIVDGAFGVADIAIASQLVNYTIARGTIDPRRWPRLARHVQATLARPAFAVLLEEERKSLPA